MARATDRLTARTVQTAKVPPKWAKFLPDGRGLYLRVAAAGTKSWIYRYRQGKKLHDMGLGPYPDVSLAEARERAVAQRKLRLDGNDPIAARKATRMAARLDAAKVITFRQCAEAYIAAHRPSWRNPKHAAQWPATLAAYVYPVFGDLHVAAVDVGLVMRAIEPIWTNKPETASRVRGRIESVLDWATVSGYRTGENPARWKGHLEHKLPKRSKVARVEHHAALPYAELPRFMAELRQQHGVAARASGLCHPDCGPHRRGYRRDLGRARFGSLPMDGSGLAHEGWARTPGAAQRGRYGGPTAIAGSPDG